MPTPSTPRPPTDLDRIAYAWLSLQVLLNVRLPAARTRLLRALGRLPY